MKNITSPSSLAYQNQWGGFLEKTKTVVPQTTGIEERPLENLAMVDLARRVSALEDTVKKLKNRINVSNILISTLGSDQWEVKQPLNVAIEQRGAEEFIACLYDVNLYGYGDSIPEALNDLKLAIINQFKYLSEQEGKVQLANILKMQLEFLRKILVRADA